MFALQFPSRFLRLCFRSFAREPYSFSLLCLSLQNPFLFLHFHSLPSRQVRTQSPHFLHGFDYRFNLIYSMLIVFPLPIFRFLYVKSRHSYFCWPNPVFLTVNWRTDKIPKWLCFLAQNPVFLCFLCSQIDLQFCFSPHLFS